MPLQFTLCGYKACHSSAPVFPPRQTADRDNRPKRDNQITSLSNLFVFWVNRHSLGQKAEVTPAHVCIWGKINEAAPLEIKNICIFGIL